MAYRGDKEKTSVEGNPENIPGGYGHADSTDKVSKKEEKGYKGKKTSNTGIAPGEKKDLKPGEDADASSG
ncbi:hypothetical protein RCC89_13665 [Cytophagaceae bacterium ABcell3]|nr:hypothetical protein RCC89_13665 [Cytophagaceae bacterium ABcell3]